jgi:hypothetical protein
LKRLTLSKWSIQPQKQLVARDATIRSLHNCKLPTNRITIFKNTRICINHWIWNPMVGSSWKLPGKAALKGYLFEVFSYTGPSLSEGQMVPRRSWQTMGISLWVFVQEKRSLLSVDQSGITILACKEHLSANALFPRTTGYKQEFSRLFYRVD